MQKPIFFEHEQVQPKNLSFLNSSVEKNIKDTIVTLTNGAPGIVQGLTLTGISGNNYFTVSQGYGYDGNGERIQVYSGTNVNIDFSGTKNVYLTFGSVVYNPDPSENPSGASNIVYNINPDDNSKVAVENYNFPIITTSTGVGYITIGTVTADGGMLFTTSSASGSSNLLIGGIIDVNTQTINGLNVSSGTIDSSLFTNPLTYDIYLGTDVDVLLLNSGNNNIGTTASPLSNVYAVTGNFHEIKGLSPIRMDSIWQKTGTSLEATGNNTIQIDTNMLGTRFGNGLTLNSNSISTAGLDKDINITTDPLKRINLDASVNVTSGHNLYVKDNFYVSGTAYLGSTNIVGVTGDFAVAGKISYGSSTQLYDNQIRNSAFSIASGNASGVVAPAAWMISVPGQNFAYGPITNSAEYLNTPASLNTAMNVMASTGNYTIEMNIKRFGNSAFGDNYNQMWVKFSNTPANGGNFYIKTDGKLATYQNSAELTGTNIATNQWYHVAYTWDGAFRRLWVNGLQVAADSTLGNWVTTTEQRIGAFGANSRNFNGLIDNFKISNVARTSFTSGSAYSGIDSNTIGLWQFERNLADSTVNARSLVQVGVATGTFTDTGLGQVFSGTIAGTGVEASLSPLTRNVYIAEPHVQSLLLGSGSNINSTGITISQILSDVRPNTGYNLSLYTKNFNAAASGLGINVVVSGTTGSGTPSLQQLNPALTTFNSTEWSKLSYNFTTPNSGSNFNLNLGIYATSPTGLVSNALFGLSGFQLTEGLGTLPYSSHERVKQYVFTSPVNTQNFDITAGVNGTSEVTSFSGTFTTKGGFATLNANILTDIVRSTAGFNQDTNYGLYYYIDKKLVAMSRFNLPYGMANGIATGYGMYNMSSASATTYLDPGSHMLQVYVYYASAGAANTGYWTYRVYGLTSSNLSLTVFE
jgi:hypothetical protein